MIPHDGVSFSLGPQEKSLGARILRTAPHDELVALALLQLCAARGLSDTNVARSFGDSGTAFRALA
jgi:hypothetical protein